MVAALTKLINKKFDAHKQIQAIAGANNLSVDAVDFRHHNGNMSVMERWPFKTNV